MLSVIATWRSAVVLDVIWLAVCSDSWRPRIVIMRTIDFSLRPVMPFRLDLTAWALRRRNVNAVDVWKDETFRRVMIVNGKPALLSVSQQGLKLNVSMTGKHLGSSAKEIATLSLERMLGIHLDLANFYLFASKHPRLARLADRFRGMKPPRFLSVFEGLINGIACQQLSLTVGVLFLNRLVERYGLEFDNGVHAFPRPKELAYLEPNDLRLLGYSKNKARSIIEISRAIVLGQLDLEALNGLDTPVCFERLIALNGVGRWTAEYVLLRALGRTEVFPGDDVGARKNLETWLRLKNRLDYSGVRRILEPWKEYGGLIFLHLLLNNLEKQGLWSGPTPTK